MHKSIRDALTEQKGQPTDEVKMLLALNKKPDDACLTSLKASGLHIDDVMGDKLIGRAPRASVAQLKQHPDVVEVELSTPLKPHNS